MASYRVPVLQDFSWQPPVKDKDLTAPPGGEVKGDRYIVGASGSGDWTGLDNHIVTYDGSSWLDDTPSEGWQVWIEDENKFYYYDGSSWTIMDINAISAQTISNDSEISAVSAAAVSNDSEISAVSAAAVTNDSEISAVSAAVVSNDSEISALEVDKQDIGTYVAEYGALTFTI